jgi:hypothetical protein
MSTALQELRRAAAERQQQQADQQMRQPLRSPEVSNFDANSIASAASSWRTNKSRASQLLEMASAKSATFHNTHSETQSAHHGSEKDDDNNDPFQKITELEKSHPSQSA